jgi:hypothetical protein
LYKVNFIVLKVINTDPSKVLGVFDDVSKVEKFELDQSEYEKKTGWFSFSSTLLSCTLLS